MLFYPTILQKIGIFKEVLQKLLYSFETVAANLTILAYS